uniref:hypothetical protein n=1 Tax=Ruminococcus sp. TaxID=41978 RepID=UPI0025E2861D
HIIEVNSLKILSVFLSGPLFHFFYNRASETACLSKSAEKGLYYRKKSAKSLWKGVRGDSPQCGEMSEGQRGAPPSEGTFPQKGFPR